MQAIDTSAAAFLAGLVTSLHCVGMCGPLSCSWALGKAGTPAAGHSFLINTSLYHGSRLVSYGLIGMIAGLIGVMPLRWFQHGRVHLYVLYVALTLLLLLFWKL